MRRVLPFLLTALAAFGIAHAEVPRHTLTASTGAPLFAGVTYEYAFAATENVEVTWGVQGQMDVTIGNTFPDFWVRPFLVAGYYVGTGSVWLELTVPEGFVPSVGQGKYWVTLSTQYRW